jgi:hypothetical protein
MNGQTPPVPYVFIVGCPRSGTTLLQRIVNAHPHIAIIHETHWVTRWFEEGKGLTPEGFVTPAVIPSLLEYHRFHKLHIVREDLENLVRSDAPVSYSRFVTGIFELYRKRKGKRLVGDKTPGYVRSLPTLHSLWPSAKFVHLVRDGRDVYLSIMQWKMGGILQAERFAGRFAAWTEDPVTTAALYWKWHVQLGREAGHSLAPGLYYEIRYESLVAQPEDQCLRLCAFLGLPYDDRMLRFHEGRTRNEPGIGAKRAWLPITPGLRDWRSQMPAADVERFEAAAGDLLEELGYARALPRSEALIHASRVRDLFTHDLRSLGNRLPDKW